MIKLSNLLIALLGITGGILGILSIFKMCYIIYRERQDAKNLSRCMAFDTLVSIVQTVVMSIEHEENPSMDLTDETTAHSQHEALRTEALQRVKAQLSDDDIQIISDNIQDIDTYILDLVSQQFMLIERGLIEAIPQL